MLTSRYMVTTKNLPAILDAMIKGTAPAKFSFDHLKGLGFKSSNDRAIIPLLKDLKFLAPDGTPTQRYHQFRGDPRAVLGEALRESYADIFTVTENPSDSDRLAIIGKFKAALGVSDTVAERQAQTFLHLLKRADLKAGAALNSKPDALKLKPNSEDKRSDTDKELEVDTRTLSLRYNIEIHLPATKDIEVYRAIFKAVREHLAE